MYTIAAQKHAAIVIKKLYYYNKNLFARITMRVSYCTIVLFTSVYRLRYTHVIIIIIAVRLLLYNDIGGVESSERNITYTCINVHACFGVYGTYLCLYIRLIASCEYDSHTNAKEAVTCRTPIISV